MRKALVFFSFILILATGWHLPCFAQSRQNPQTAPEQSQSPAAPQPKNVTAIDIQGNKSISSNTIVSKMKTRVGSPYQETVVSDDLKRLYLLGFFANISIDTEDYKDGVKVIVKVAERPIIDKITFSGIRVITEKEEKIKEQLKSKQAQYLDYPTLAEDVDILKKMYEKKGYSQAEVNYTVEVNKETNKAAVNFAVTENRRIAVKNIYVRGNTAFSAGRILKIIKTKRAWLFNAGVLKDEVLKEDIERVKAFYQKRGYSDVAVDYAVAADAKKPNLLYVTIKITEGKKYLVGNVKVEGNQVISEKEALSKLTECLPGRVFSQDGVKMDLAQMQSAYFDRGYIMARIDESTAVNSDSGRVDISYKIVENDVVYVDKLKVQGNVKTKDIVVRREMRIRPGDRFDGEKLRRSKERIQNLGYFEDVSYEVEDTSVPNKKDLVVDVKETKTGSFSFGGGYSTVDAFMGFIEIEQKNFDWKNFPYFTGGGQDLKLRASIGTTSSSDELSFTEPWVFDYPVSFGFDVYRREHKRAEDAGYGYDERVTGGDVRLGKELGEYVNGTLMFRHDVININNFSDDASPELTKERGSNTINSAEFGLTYDSRDNVFDPGKGDLLSSTFEVAGGPLSGTKDFLKYYGRASHYIPLWRKSTLELRGRVGLAKPYASSVELPLYERYFAGGAYTIRGYDERSIGPFDPASKDALGGNAMFVGNLEYLYPIYDFLKAAVFFDTGNVWPKAGDIGKDKLFSSYGLGVRIKTPVGPVMLDYGIPMNKQPGEDSRGSGKFHFSMSNSF